MAIRPLPAAASVPTRNGPDQPSGSSPRMTSVQPLKSTAPRTTGTSSRKEKRAAASRSKRRARAIVIVIPERETPGASAAAWASPIAIAWPKRRSPIVRSCGMRSASQSSTPKTARKTAICQGSPRCSSTTLSPSAPASAAGIVAANTHQAVRSSMLRIPLWPTLRNQAATSATMSSQKYATTAISVPR
jgi:hypothetical protein